ncbi:hypothetical protein [Culturomica massiliensis]|uniref:hypothetical protein n=1 Tax=Culturomica massiliensis TaxID=1841857 RepID=UPI003AF0CFCF
MKVIILLVVISLTMSCVSPKSNRAESIRLTDSAVSLKLTAYMACDSIRTDSILRRSLSLLTTALEKDAMNSAAAENKITLEFLLDDYHSAISTIKMYEKQHGRIYPEMRFVWGLCALQSGCNTQARQLFKQARDEFRARNDTLNFYFVSCFLDGKQAVIAEIDTIQSLRNLKEMIQSVNLNNPKDLFK